MPPDHPDADRQVPGPGALPGHPRDRNHRLLPQQHRFLSQVLPDIQDEHGDVTRW